MQVGGEADDPVPDGGNPPESASADTADHVRQNGNGMAPGSDTRALRDPPGETAICPLLSGREGSRLLRSTRFPPFLSGSFPYLIL